MSSNVELDIVRNINSEYLGCYYDDIFCYNRFSENGRRIYMYRDYDLYIRDYAGNLLAKFDDKKDGMILLNNKYFGVGLKNLGIKNKYMYIDLHCFFDCVDILEELRNKYNYSYKILGYDNKIESSEEANFKEFDNYNKVNGFS